MNKNTFRNGQNRKGFLFSLEATFALIITMTLIGSIMFLLLSIESEKKSSDKLFLFSNDILLNLDQKRIMLNDTELSEVIDDFVPTQYCMRFDITNDRDLIILSHTKLGCENYADDASIAKRTYVENNNYYIARILMWYRE